jgi:hypothetical protein
MTQKTLHTGFSSSQFELSSLLDSLCVCGGRFHLAFESLVMIQPRVVLYYLRNQLKLGRFKEAGIGFPSMADNAFCAASLAISTRVSSVALPI